MKKFDALVQISMQLEPLKVKLEKLVNEIKIQLVGRLVRPKTMKDLLYEVQDFNADSSNVKLRRLLDQNGILFSRNNSPDSRIFKSIRGLLLQKHYEVVQ